MACYREDASTRKVRESNSVIRNRNHILKCTLKTMLDNPSRTRDRALCSLVGLCRKQCNGPIELPPPKRVISVPTVEPLYYTPCCPRAIESRSNQKPEKPRPYPQHPRKPRDDISSKPPPSCEAQICEPCCGCSCCCPTPCCCVCYCCPRPRSSSPTDVPRRPCVSAGKRPPCFPPRKVFGSPRSKGRDRCSRRCCNPQTSMNAAPVTMSPLCCPPPVKALSLKPTSPTRCSPLVRSCKCIPARRERMYEASPKRFGAPAGVLVAPYPRPYSAPGSNICRNNGDHHFLGNSCASNDSDVDPPNRYASRNFLQPSPHARSSSLARFDVSGFSTGGSAFSSGAIPLSSPALAATVRSAAPHSDSKLMSSIVGALPPSAQGDPFSITTWRTSKPVRFSSLPRKKSSRL